MPNIPIEKSTFERLQELASPLVDMADTVINRALDALEDRKRKADSKENPAVVDNLIDPQNLPDMTRTAIMKASMEGQSFADLRWNPLFQETLVRIGKRLGSIEKIRQICPVKVVQGCRTDSGYRHLAEIDISVRSMSGNDVCKALVTFVQRLGIEFDIIIEGLSPENPKFPGGKARLHLFARPTAK